MSQAKRTEGYWMQLLWPTEHFVVTYLLWWLVYNKLFLIRQSFKVLFQPVSCESGNNGVLFRVDVTVGTIGICYRKYPLQKIPGENTTCNKWKPYSRPSSLITGRLPIASTSRRRPPDRNKQCLSRITRRHFPEIFWYLTLFVVNQSMSDNFCNIERNLA